MTAVCELDTVGACDRQLPHVAAHYQGDSLGVFLLPVSVLHDPVDVERKIRGRPNSFPVRYSCTGVNKYSEGGGGGGLTSHNIVGLSYRYHG